MYRLLLALINGQIIPLQRKGFICAAKYMIVINALY